VKPEESRDGDVLGAEVAGAVAAEATLSTGEVSRRAVTGAAVYVLRGFGVRFIGLVGLLVGIIEDFRVRELDSYATIKPAVDLTTLEEVFVVISETK